MKAELDKVTRLLCGVLSQIEAGTPADHLVTPELSEWWEQHQAADTKRLRESALAKLTFAEMKALGVES